MSSEYENILRQLGSFGPYQRRAFLLVSMFETPLAWAMLTPILLNYRPDFYCPDWTGLQATLLQDNDSDPYLVSQIFSFQSLDLYQFLSNTSHVNVTVTTNQCHNHTVCPGLKFEDGFTSIVTQFKLICDKEFVPETVTSIQMCGVLVGAIITGQLADLFGRRQILYIQYAILVIMWFCSAFAGTWMIYAVLRFIIGALIGGVLVVNFVLPLEIVTPEWRTFCGCIGLWAIGLMSLAGWGYLIRDWQYLIIATSSASLFILLSWWFVPESPRWLLSRGQVAKAEKILTKMAKYNGKPVPDYTQLRAYAQREVSQRQSHTRYSYWHLCKTWKLAKNSMILMYGWFVSSAVYYGLNFNTSNLTGDLYLNMFFSGLVEIPALLFVVLVHNRLGRRLTVSILMFIAGISCFSILVLDLIGKLQSLQTLSVVFAMIGKAGISGGWAALQVFSAEIFPTVVRNIGVGSCSFCARIGGIVAPQIVFMGTSAQPLPFTVFGIISMLCGGMVWLLPETEGTPLPDDLIIEIEVEREVENEAVPLNRIDNKSSDKCTNGTVDQINEQQV